jgi:hypothetical protein
MVSSFASVLGVLVFVAIAAGEGPCDILDAAGNPCVAAHSTVRALYAKYSGPLYNVTRSSDGKSANIGVLSAGGFADKSQHDTFCSKMDCVISNVFDQSPQKNHLGPSDGCCFWPSRIATTCVIMCARGHFCNPPRSGTLEICFLFGLFQSQHSHHIVLDGAILPALACYHSDL